MIEKLKNWYALNRVKRYLRERGFADEQIERKIVIAQLRSHLRFFGHDVANLTDEEIEQGVLEFSKAFASTGVSVDKAIEGLSFDSK